MTERRKVIEGGLQQIACGNGMSMLQWNSFSNAVLTMLEEVEATGTRLAEAEKIIEDAARVELIDAESSGDEIVFRFTMKGEQLFNPPMFVRGAQAFIGEE